MTSELGAVFQMRKIGEPGPAPGGPLTLWHAHENVCLSITPPSLSGLLSPLGGCPVGSITVPITPEMIHVWIVPGAPHRTPSAISTRSGDAPTWPA